VYMKQLSVKQLSPAFDYVKFIGDCHKLIIINYVTLINYVTFYA